MDSPGTPHSQVEYQGALSIALPGTGIWPSLSYLEPGEGAIIDASGAGMIMAKLGDDPGSNRTGSACDESVRDDKGTILLSIFWYCGKGYGNIHFYVWRVLKEYKGILSRH